MIHPLPSTMKAPRDRRPVWRGGVLQIWVTRTCDRACFGCTQGSNLGGRPAMITVDQFRTACRSLRNPDYWGVVGIFGGNPCTHPEFPELCRVMREEIPRRQRGLWSNNLNGHGAVCRATFNPRVSNLNVHQDQAAYDEMRREWPRANVKGLDGDSRHGPPYVAVQDVVEDEAERWRLIGACDVNQNWSAMICVFRGELRAYFCELAGAQAMLHGHESDYPDLGHPVTSGWWDRPMEAFDAQVRYHCMACGIPLKGHGALANAGPAEQVSKTHQGIYKPKVRGRGVQLVTLRTELGPPLGCATNYIENGSCQPSTTEPAPVLQEEPPQPVQRIDGLVTCVGPLYLRYLLQSLPVWMSTLDSVTVVTDVVDTSTIQALAPLVATENRLRVVTTGLFHRYEAAFNKGAALNYGLNQLRPTDWALNFDADILPPPDWREHCQALFRECLYGASRYYAQDSSRRYDVQQLRCHPHKGHLKEIRSFKRLIGEDKERVPDHDLYGYFHLWHAQCSRTQDRPLWDVHWGSAGHYDLSFLRRWPEDQRRRLPIKLVHRGTPRKNWFGEGREGMMDSMWQAGLGRSFEQRIGMLGPEAVAELTQELRL